MRAGSMRERLKIQQFDPATIRLTALTRSGTTATATTLTNHGYVTGEFVTIAGATPSGYDGRFKVTVTGAKTFTFTVSNALSTPATGLPTVTYYSDAQGGKRTFWTDFLSGVPAELIPMGTSERLQRAAVQSDVLYRFKIRRIAGLSPKMRALWTPSWPPDATEVALEITGVLPDQMDPISGLLIECAESARP